MTLSPYAAVRRPSGVASRAIVRVGGLLVVAVLAVAAWGCSEPPGPEAQIRALIADMEAGAESGDIGPFKAALASSFQGEGGLDRARALNRVRLFLLGRRSLHVLVRIREVTVTGEADARASVLVATAGRPMDSPDALSAYRADVHQVRLFLDRTGGEWRVYRAEWAPASVGELVKLW